MYLGEAGSSSKKMKTVEEKNHKPIRKKLSALVVDDDPLIRKVHSAILKSLGFIAQLASNGKEAVDVFRHGANFDIVFIDMDMPIMNGIEVQQQRRYETCMGVTCKIVAVTSRGTDVEMEDFVQAGADFHRQWPRSYLSLSGSRSDDQKT
ncbi:hypothetical protein JRO89_XS04G0145000 [Xanthoceras sorbifolium]|uniref:Response regulatory domain-containing protein n=1 Tax=Xanthoceras sorbifolium TaxID=99658 RepID=A0ABQ8I591_9ROSI|nr:hypothetical protein JRO89_XS04G0145000 [Xanthoceras sorbifolium]